MLNIMPIRLILILLIVFFSLGFSHDHKIQIQWIDNLKGNFDFRTKWSYPEGVYKNGFGQLDCDGLCPEGIESMKDDQGIIYPDSSAKFYHLLDTTHQYHSISCEALCYEWAGTDFISALRANNNRLLCSTQTNAGTHCSLIFEILNNSCIPRIALNSITPIGRKTYYCAGGFIKIDKKMWSQGFLKAEFNFNFSNTDEPGQKLFWKGRIYTKIDNQ
jgi:hypothetical protein